MMAFFLRMFWGWYFKSVILVSEIRYSHSMRKMPMLLDNFCIETVHKRYFNAYCKQFLSIILISLIMGKGMPLIDSS